MRSKKSKNNIEELEEVCSQIFPSMNQSLNRTTAPSSSKVQERKVFNQVYKLKQSRLKPFENTNNDQKSKKTLDELFSTKRVLVKKDSQKLDDSRNHFNNTSSQVSQRDMLNSFYNKGACENSTFVPRPEKPNFEHDMLKGNNVKSIETSRRVSSSSKERTSLFQNTSSQSKIIRSINPPPYANPSSRKNISAKVNQIRRVGDLDMFKIDISSNLPTKQELGTSVQNINQPIRRHRRGLSMDQNPHSSQNLAIQAPKVEKIQKIVLEPQETNLPQPNQNQANAQNDEAAFFEQFFDVDKMTFDFEKLVVMQRNKRKNEGQNPSLSSTVYSRQTSIHTRTKSTEEGSNPSANKPPSRLASKRMSLGNAS